MSARFQTLRRHSAPLRVRLTLAFASVMAVVLALTAVLIQAQFARDLTNRTDEELAAHQSTALSVGTGLSPADLVAILGEPLAQVYATDGTITATTRRLGTQRLATPAAVRRATSRAVSFDRPGVVSEDGARVRLFTVPGNRVVAVAGNLETREHALARLALLLGLGMTAALVVSSLTGYQVAKAALAPVERMRSRASEIVASEPGRRLPVPATEDEIQRLAETMNELLGRLESALERERRIVGDASHELRTPISILRARVGFALRGDLSAPELLEVLKGLDHDAERLATLADDLLVLARADQGALALRLDPLEVQELIEAAAERSRSIDPTATVQTHVDIDGGAVVLGDQTRLMQLLDNLLQNARTYGSSPIVVTARAGDRPDTIAIDVADAGPGFPTAFLPQAFDRFSQADPSHSGTGTGLGLAIVDAIARAHGGRAFAGAGPAGGATVTVELPSA